MTSDPDEDFSSPACSMQAASDTYMGYASAAELADHLTELLAAEQAAVRCIEKMLPRVRDDKLHADLRAMLTTHENTIAVANHRLAALKRE